MVDGDILDVESAHGSKYTQLGGHERTPELLARLLLNELIAEGLTRGDGGA